MRRWTGPCVRSADPSKASGPLGSRPCFGSGNCCPRPGWIWVIYVALVVATGLMLLRLSESPPVAARRGHLSVEQREFAHARWVVHRLHRDGIVDRPRGVPRMAVEAGSDSRSLGVNGRTLPRDYGGSAPRRLGRRLPGRPADSILDGGHRTSRTRDLDACRMRLASPGSGRRRQRTAFAGHWWAGECPAHRRARPPRRGRRRAIAVGIDTGAGASSIALGSTRTCLPHAAVGRAAHRPAGLGRPSRSFHACPGVGCGCTTVGPCRDLASERQSGSWNITVVTIDIQPARGD